MEQSYFLQNLVRIGGLNISTLTMMIEMKLKLQAPKTYRRRQGGARRQRKGKKMREVEYQSEENMKNILDKSYFRKVVEARWTCRHLKPIVTCSLQHWDQN